VTRAVRPGDGSEVRRCDVDAAVEAKFPGLGLWGTTVAGGVGRTPREIRGRLERLADRIGGAEAVALRTRPVPQAYRVLFRQLGLDPDVVRTPLEALVFERLMHGGVRSHGMPADALALAVLETGVAVLALDADRVAGGLALRPAMDGERLEGTAVPAGRLVVADERRPCAVLFGAVGCGPGRTTTAVLLVGVQAPGVPDAAVDEALWIAADAVSVGDG
jgi:DNA/RNA-binding domain of Phe-tRNA-synthetase-like protein